MTDVEHMEQSNELRHRHTRFHGDWGDLSEFEQLASSPIRSAKRSTALARWSDYKLQRQQDEYRAFKSERLTEQVRRGELTASEAEQRLLAGGKGTYIRSLTHRAVNLTGADLINLPRDDPNSRDSICIGYVDLRGAILDDACLRGACLKGANLENASMRNADLTDARLLRADLRRADLIGCHLAGADLSGADFASARLSGCDLRGADLRYANLVGADLTNADLTGCRIYGTSAWGLELNKTTKQHALIITPDNEPEITVDSIETAQVIYLLLRNEKIRDVIDTIGRKGVLLLGRFTGGRIEILKKLREKLRTLGFVPMVFNFDKPETKDFTETVRLLAGLSHFVIVDLSCPRSVPLELQALVPNNAIPFAPIIEQGQDPFAMFVDLQNNYDCVLPVIGYSSTDRLIEVLEDKIVKRAEEKFNELLKRRTKQLRVEIA